MLKTLKTETEGELFVVRPVPVGSRAVLFNERHGFTGVYFSRGDIIVALSGCQQMYYDFTYRVVLTSRGTGLMMANELVTFEELLCPETF